MFRRTTRMHSNPANEARASPIAYKPGPRSRVRASTCAAMGFDQVIVCLNFLLVNHESHECYLHSRHSKVPINATSTTVRIADRI
jgi:hypothetical protein